MTHRVEPSASHICDVARVRHRAAINELTESTRRRDIELAKKPAGMQHATRHEAMILISNRLVTFWESLRDEYCGL